MKILQATIIIILCLITCFANGQLKNTKLYSRVNGLCSWNIILDSLGYFFKESGCEGRSQISYGKYKVNKNNIVNFYSLPFDSLQPFRKIRRYKNTNDNDSIITISLFSRENKPLGFIFNIQILGIDGNLEEFNTNKKGQLFINCYRYKELLLTQLLSIYKQAAPIIFGEESIEIYLNLPEFFLMYTETSLDKVENFKLVLKKDGLYKLDGKTKIYSLSK